MKVVWGVIWAVSVFAAYFLGITTAEIPKGDSEPEPESQSDALAGDNDSRTGRKEDVLHLEREIPQEESGNNGQEHLGESLRQAMRQTDALQSTLHFGQVFQRLTEQNLGSAIAVIEERMGHPKAFRALYFLMNSWAGFDPEGALEYSLYKVGGVSGKRAAGIALSSWARSDPQAALSWAQTNEKEKGEFSLSPGLVYGWSQHNLGDAAAFVATMPDGPQKERAIGAVAFKYLEEGIDEMKEWVASLSDPSYKGPATAAISKYWGSIDPVAASEWVSEFATTDHAEDAIDKLVDRWASVEPMSAATWIVELPEDARIQKGLGTLIERWSEKDPDAAGNWLNEVASDSAYDKAVDGFARQAAKDDLSAAITWSESIGDPETRNRSLIDVGRIWFREDPDATEGWVEKTNLPEHVAEAILNPPPEESKERRKWLQRADGR